MGARWHVQGRAGFDFASDKRIVARGMQLVAMQCCGGIMTGSITRWVLVQHW